MSRKVDGPDMRPEVLHLVYLALALPAVPVPIRNGGERTATFAVDHSVPL